MTELFVTGFLILKADNTNINGRVGKRKRPSQFSRFLIDEHTLRNKKLKRHESLDSSIQIISYSYKLILNNRI